jgi:hypothetical protein
VFRDKLLSNVKKEMEDEKETGDPDIEWAIAGV